MYAETLVLLPGIRKVDKYSLEVLGSPILQVGFERMSKVESLELLGDRLKLVDVHPDLCV